MNAPQPASLEQRLQQTEQALARISNRLAAGARRTRILGLLLLCLIAGYFAYGYREIRTLVGPDHLVPLAGNMLDDSLPELRHSLHQTVAASAPVWAEGLSTTAVEAAPRAREALEEYVLNQTQVVLEHATTLGEDQFRKILREHRAEMEQTLAQLANDQNYSDETLKIFVAALNDELGRDLQEQSHEVLGTLIGLKEKLQRLAKGGTLSQEEALERHALMTVRHIQLSQADESFANRLKKRDELRREAEAPAAPEEGAKPPEGKEPAAAAPDAAPPAAAEEKAK
jgi:hypothetical protein